MARSSNSRSIKAAIKPYKKESTYTNIFSIPVLLWIFGYVCFNFWMEWRNWDKLLKNAAEGPPQDPNATTIERWLTVDVNSNAVIGMLRLEQVCDSLEVLDMVFINLCIIIPLLSIVRFVLRQQKIFNETLKCNNGMQWLAGFVFLAIMRAIEALVALVLMTMVLPSSFFMCYRVVAMYFCTLTFAIFVGFIICIIITSAVSQSVLVYDIQYTSLGIVGKDEIDVIETKRRRVSSSKKRFHDNEEDSLMDDESQYSDELTEKEKEYVDRVV